jgi:hypothetical protein
VVGVWVAVWVASILWTLEPATSVVWKKHRPIRRSLFRSPWGPQPKTAKEEGQGEAEEFLVRVSMMMRAWMTVEGDDGLAMTMHS